MRWFLILLLLGSSVSASAATSSAERRAMNRVIARAWPDGDHARRAALAEQLAEDVHRECSDTLRQTMYEHALTTATTVRRGLTARRNAEPGLSEAEFGTALTALVRAYQAAAAERFDQVNGATGLTAGVLSVVCAVPLCISLGIYDYGWFDRDTIDTAIKTSFVTSFALTVTSATYLGFRSTELGKSLWSVPGMAYLARKLPGASQLRFFWSEIDRVLADESEWRYLRGPGELRPNQYLNRFTKLLESLAPTNLSTSCERVLGHD